MASRQEWLNQGFQLRDHPFESVQVAVNPPQGGAPEMRLFNLSRPLEVFAAEKLGDYFTRVGSIDTAVKNASDFLNGQGNNIDLGPPPVLLIEGPTGTGRKTLGHFVAHLIRAHCKTPPNLRVVPVPTSHFGRLLFEVRYKLEEHLKFLKLDTAPLRSRNEFIKPEDPDETVLAGLFSSVAQETPGLPMLILLLDSLEYRNFEWIAKLHGMLKDLNVALVFLTKDDLVTELFAASLQRGDYIGCVLRLAPLEMQDGIALLGKRLSMFRLGAAGAMSSLTPYEIAAIRWIFTGGNETRAVKILLNLCRVAMNLKLEDLLASKAAIPSQPGTGVLTITEQDVRKAYETSVRQVAWGGKK